MAKISGSTRLKVHKAPAFWDISRKHHRFVLKPIPGPHAINSCYPLGVLIRDILGLTNNLKETKRVLLDAKVKVDGKVRYDPHFPVGLMDTISIEPINRYYRLVAKDKIPLTPIEIDAKESNLKICKIRSKVTVKGNRLQYGLHDGRCIIDNIDAKVNDSLLLKVPEQEVLDILRLEKGADVLIVRGDNVGKRGVVEEIRGGTFTLPKRAIINIGDRLLELPVDMLMVIGKDNNIPIKV